MEHQLLLLTRGFYTVKTSYGIRIVALNTNFYYTPNKLVSPEGDPAGQFAWLTETLGNAKDQNEKVIVTAHISPGVTDIPLFPDQNDKLVKILRQYADIIVAMHFGHEHTDAFKVLKNTAGVPTAPIFLAPSIAPLRFGPMKNPGVRLVKYDRVTGKHVDISQYYLDLNAANRAGVADWKLEYTASDAYNIQDLTASSLAALIDRMKDSDSTEFKTYRKFYYVSPPEDLIEDCDWKCHAFIFCGFTEFNLDDVKKCEKTMVSGAIE
ncbi:acid sphingomyelinase-like phosphodiesterase 3a [Mercenaria mercenaria]|uniref:acid sphingomyelinase-like phosphodiesterase 3a n=1 Tax=Mercenaria mercenaria TaxID=6596 RepID=UPI00234E6AC7|nr:acid sphingomyelinase-like phosphodiesterase 3a [Mercenaria mercenaria]